MPSSIKSETYLNIAAPICAALERPSMVITPLWRALTTIFLVLLGLASSVVFILELSILAAGSRYVNYTPADWLAGIVVLAITALIAGLSFWAFAARIKPARNQVTPWRHPMYDYD